MKSFIKIKWILLFAVILAILIPGFYTIKDLLRSIGIKNQEIISGAVYTFVVTLCISFANFRFFLFLQKKYPWKKYILKRILIELPVSSLNAAIIITLIALTSHFFISRAPADMIPSLLFENALIAVIVNIIAMSFIEGIFFFNQWKTALVETEQLKRRNIEMQYSTLTAQLNPHFLFNSLNALTSLIKSEPEKAMEFTREFAKIYRYVLDVKDKIVVELSEEVTFINSYIFLQQIRFGNNLQVKIDLEQETLSKFLPPLSLQLLIENAIKHNEISSEYPLSIRIYAVKDELIVENNFQPRNTKEESTGLGLMNLIERYNHYTSKKPKFGVSRNNYVAQIPLISDE